MLTRGALQPSRTGVMVPAGSSEGSQKSPQHSYGMRGPLSPREGRLRFKFQPVKPAHNNACARVPSVCPLPFLKMPGAEVRDSSLLRIMTLSTGFLPSISVSPPSRTYKHMQQCARAHDNRRYVCIWKAFSNWQREPTQSRRTT